MQEQLLLQHPPIYPWLQRLPDTCRVQLLCSRRDNIQIYLRAEPDNEEQLIAMQVVGQRASYTVFQAEFPWDEANPSSLYLFKLVFDGQQLWLAADGQHSYIPPRDVHFKVARLAKNQPPAWTYDQIFYQIFPDRFFQGNPALAQQAAHQYPSSVTKKWGEPIDRTQAAQAFYGGDLPGIQKKLAYLQNQLGVTALYLNPIFSSGSNHRYDTEDYFQVDARLGGNAAFAELMKEVRQRSMRLILDAVVNHTSDNHPWFNRDGRHGIEGAYQNVSSPYRHWYSFSAEHDYCSWKGHQHLPVLDMAVPAVQEMVYQGNQSILRFWMRPPYAIDGWRFDVLHMLGEGRGAGNNAHYVREFRRVMQEENPQSYVLGEQFNEATRWLQGEQEDGAMNYYGFAHPVRAWLAQQDLSYDPIQIDSALLDDWLTQSRVRIPYANQLAQLNLLDSHDTVRFLTLLQGDTARMQLAVALLMTYPGIPCIYYGDEIGMEGGNDPDCRRCFDWDTANWNRPLFDTYQQLIALRQQRAELRHGAFLSLYAYADVFIFARFTEQQVCVIAINRAATAQPVAAQADQILDFLEMPHDGWQQIDLPRGSPLNNQASHVWPITSLPAYSVQIWLNQVTAA